MLIVVYDDTIQVTPSIKTIIGDKRFGEIILKRQSMLRRAKTNIDTIDDTKFIHLKTLEDPSIFNTLPEDAVFFHLPSSSAIISEDDFKILLQKLIFTKEPLTIVDGDTVFGAVFNNRTAYLDFFNEYTAHHNLDFLKLNTINAKFFIDLSNYDNLLMYISSGFDARFFNSLQGDAYTITKKSQDKKKMQAEYKYYWLLPESMKNWMVMPYDYQEHDDYAEYTMERLPMTDIAIRWTHGAISLEELDRILDKSFYFFSHRTAKKITKQEHQQTADKLYLTKVEERLDKFKTLPEYKTLNTMISLGTEFNGYDDLVSHYKDLYRKYSKPHDQQRLVIGHGDPFFANMLYSKETNFLRFIDPKGALQESDLWTDPCYDIAKLSHSVCGNYDFFNTDSFDIYTDKNLQLQLSIHTNNTSAKELFRKYLESNNYDYHTIRLYEASLFLSMLPLHIDNPGKVLGFTLNAINILKEVENV